MLGKSLALILAALAAVHGDSRIIYRFYHDNTVTLFNVDNLHTILQHSGFSAARQTVIFHYGADQRIETPEVNDVINSYVGNQRYNFIAIDYESINTVSTGNANELADGITTSLIRLFDNGYSSGQTNLVGFSLGAQIMARASRLTQNRSNRRHVIGRLTGLDPLSLGPINGVTIGTLSSVDAQIVESIHTEGNNRGDHESRGHVSFFVNGGMNQPWCTQTMPGARADCSHVFALTVWAETARASTGVFPSLQCDSWTEFTSGFCNGNAVAYIGRTNANNLRGTYFLRTNNWSPFSRNTPFP